MVGEELARRWELGKPREKFKGRLWEGRTGPGGPRVAILLPQTYMNESGRPVGALAQFYSLAPDRVIVVHDELDIPFAQVRLKIGGGPGGHNGVRSIDSALGTKDYARVRVGIGRPPGRMDPADFVLRDFSAAERKELPLLIERGADAVETLLRQGLAAAQNLFHTNA